MRSLRLVQLDEISVDKISRGAGLAGVARLPPREHARALGLLAPSRTGRATRQAPGIRGWKTHFRQLMCDRSRTC